MIWCAYISWEARNAENNETEVNHQGRDNRDETVPEQNFNGSIQVSFTAHLGTEKLQSEGAFWCLVGQAADAALS